jgi:hypothetical protein
MLLLPFGFCYSVCLVPCQLGPLMCSGRPSSTEFSLSLYLESFLSEFDYSIYIRFIYSRRAELVVALWRCGASFMAILSIAQHSQEHQPLLVYAAYPTAALMQGAYRSWLFSVSSCRAATSFCQTRRRLCLRLQRSIFSATGRLINQR